MNLPGNTSGNGPGWSLLYVRRAGVALVHTGEISDEKHQNQGIHSPHLLNTVNSQLVTSFQITSGATCCITGVGKTLRLTHVRLDAIVRCHAVWRDFRSTAAPLPIRVSPGIGASISDCAYRNRP